jgi:hypothetical protein
VSVVVVLLLELARGDVAEAGVQARVVEPAEVLDDRELELGATPPDAVGDQFGLEAVDERLGERVCLWRPDRCVDHLDPFASEDLVEGGQPSFATRGGSSGQRQRKES